MWVCKTVFIIGKTNLCKNKQNSQFNNCFKLGKNNNYSSKTRKKKKCFSTLYQHLYHYLKTTLLILFSIAGGHNSTTGNIQLWLKTSPNLQRGREQLSYKKSIKESLTMKVYIDVWWCGLSSSISLSSNIDFLIFMFGCSSGNRLS